MDSKVQKDTWRPYWVRGGHVEDMIFIGKDVIAWCIGVHIIFFNVAQQKESIRWCCNSEVGEGAHCLSGHSSLSIFCFAERVSNPKILVYSYPSMTLIAECTGGTRNKYLSTAFTARDHMVSIGWYPNFPLVVWAWRTGEKIARVTTFMYDQVGEILRITQVGLTVAAQMGRTCGRLYTWELDIVGKNVTLQGEQLQDNVSRPLTRAMWENLLQCTLYDNFIKRHPLFSDHEIKLPHHDPIAWVDWSSTSLEPLLAITDRNGHIYLSNYDGSNVYRIVLSQRCGICLEYESPIIKWFGEGLILRTTFCQIRYYSKNAKTQKWNMTWYVKLETKPCLLITHPVKTDWCFYHTFEGFLMEIIMPKSGDYPMVENCLNYGASFKFMDFLYPWCHHVVGTDDLKELVVLESFSGSQLTTIDLEIQSEITCQLSHLDYPMIVVGTQQGELIFVSFAAPEEPKIVAFLRLQEGPLDLIKLSYSGRSLIAAETQRGNCYCINLRPEKAFTVLGMVQSHKRINDVLIYEGAKKMIVLLLLAHKKQPVLGQNLRLYVVPEGKDLVEEFAENFDLSGTYYNLWHHPSNAMMLVGTPYMTRQLRVQKLQDFKSISLVDGLLTGHLVKMANLFVDKQWLTSTAFDGMVYVRDKTLRKVTACFLSHHRADFGSVKAVANKIGDLIVVMGYDGSLVAMTQVQFISLTIKILVRLQLMPLLPPAQDNISSCPADAQCLYRVDYTLYDKNEKKVQSDYASLSSELNEMLSGPRYQFPDPEENGEKTWFDWRNAAQLQREVAQCEEERSQILTDFEVLKGKVKALLDANEICPEIERLPVSAFDLDRAGRDQKLKTGRNQCEDLHLELEHGIGEMKRVSYWLKETFWDPQKVIGKCLVAILGNRVVANYPAVEGDPRTAELLEFSQFSKDSVSMIIDEDTFQPWKLYTDEELEVELNKCVKLHHEVDIKMDMLLEEEEDEKVISEVALAKMRAFEGTIAHQFIELSPCYSQMESYGFGHVLVNNRFLLHDCEKIRSYFNTAFEEVYAQKEREMNVIRDRIERICYINSELQTMFSGRVSYIPEDPTWHWQESPEGVVKVFDHEVKAKPYISPSQQELLDRQAAEAERIRRLLLADDFRERALMTMMDGVLEVRWEDVIKIDVPKPACMLEKRPEDFTEDDILAVKKYEKDVQFLREERERYNRKLEAEYTKVMGLLQEGIDKFNTKLDQLFRLKMNIESAINQMHLRYVRGCLRNYRRMVSLREEEKIKKQVSSKEKYLVILQNNMEIFKSLHQELWMQHELITAREKTLSKRFKGEFSTMNKFHVDLLDRQYRRRPRVNLKNLSSAEFADLVAHVSVRSRLVYLAHDCKEYLKALDQLDTRPSVLPMSLDSADWEHLVKVRRYKIESELKLRAKEAEIADAERVIEGFRKKIEKCMADIEQIKENLGENRRQRTVSELDLEMQFVMKMGQVEVELTGDFENTRNVVLVTRDEILAVNVLIEAAGQCKLEALSRLLDFQRGTKLKEWIHGCRKKQLSDLQEDLRFLGVVTVTKEMQQYLKRKAKNLPDDKTFERMTVDVEAAKAQCEKLMESRKARLASIQKDIAITRSKNEELDRQIFDLNVSRCDMELHRDHIAEARQRQHTERKIRMVMRRSNLIKKLQDNYAELLELQTLHELLRLRRYPTLHFKFLDDNDK
ncbi:cilia- and flagella-associated protein 43-like [Augochlora pura]